MREIEKRQGRGEKEEKYRRKKGMKGLCWEKKRKRKKL